MSVKGRRVVTKELILERYSEEQLFKVYCSPFKELNTPFSSEIRIGDDVPSCRISRFDSGETRYKDFGISLPALTIWDYVGIKYNLCYYDSLCKIAEDLQIVGKVIVPEIPTHTTRKIDTSNTAPTSLPIKHSTVLKIKKRDWSVCDKKFWFNRYGITIQLLKEYNVVPISYFWIEKIGITGNILYDAQECSYSYNYYWHEEVFRRKIYQPYSTKHKWISNINDTIVQGIDNIPKVAPILIISSSLKDVMCWNLLGFPAVAPNNEQTWIPETVWNKFITRYPRRIIFFDNDTAGINSSIKFSNQFNAERLYIPEEYGTKNKNVSDFIDNNGIILTKQLITNLINK